MNKRMPTIFISHGGGPWPFIDDMRPMFAKSEQEIKKIPQLLPAKPKAIISVSGHWEESDFTVSSAEHPPMVYDYSGFPEHTYKISYPAPGAPAVADQVQQLLSDAGIKCQENKNQGFDHGTFVPLYLMYPNADVPVVSLSLKSNYDPHEHIQMGRALAPLRDQGILIIGSGLSYHNMRGFRTQAGGSASNIFGNWLGSTVSQADVPMRNKQLTQWESAPAARLAHPQEDHLLPLMVVAGAAGSDLGRVLFLDEAMGVVMASYQFG